MNVVFRTDASLAIGSGHAMRCVALGGALHERGASVSFVCREHRGNLCDLIETRGFVVAPLPSPIAECQVQDPRDHTVLLGASWGEDAGQTRAAIEALGVQPDWLVVDHYALDERWEGSLRSSVRRVLVIDDLADRAHDCDVLLDQNLYHDMDTRYTGKVPSSCRLLLGPRYALLRDEFRRLHKSVRPRTGQVKRVLVFFGGVDAREHTAEAVEALASLRMRDLQVDVVIGAQQSRRQEIESVCNRHGFACHVQTERMAELMASADLAIGAGGSASWERCCLGLPTLTLCVADNQEQVIDDAALNGLLYAPALHSGAMASMAHHLRALLDNPALLRAMSRNGLHAVDGRGTQRVLRAMGYNAVAMREATSADSAKIFAWRNHPAIRAVSGNNAPIEHSVHEAWFAAALADPERLLLIGECSGKDVGVVRFDIRDAAAQVSIYLAPDLAGSGNGVELLLAAESWLANKRPEVRALHAEVLRDNHRSHGLFVAGDYRLSSTRYVKRLVANE